MFCVPVKRSAESRGVRGFETLLDRFFEEALSPEGRRFVAPVDVTADDKNVYVSAEVPGIEKKDINIEYKDGILKISGEKKEEVKQEKEGYVYREINRGEFSRSINVGDVDFEKAKAELKDGILKIELAKSESQQSRKLEIK